MVAHPSSRFRPVGLPALGVVLISAAGLALSCDKMPLTAPSGSAITLVASTSVLAVNGSADITAIVIEGGQSAGTGGTTTVTAGVGTPVQNGTLVTFTTTLGRLEPTEARTEAGRATVKLYGDGRSGTAVVTAYSGAANNKIEVPVGAAGAARILVTASPQSLPATGGTTTIAALVQDSQGNGLLGVPVSFSTTAGTLAPSSAVSGDTGVATTTLTTAAAATVTASAGATSGSGTSASPTTLTGTVDVALKPRTTLTLTPPATVAVSVPAKFTIGVGTNTVVTGVTVDFGDGGQADLGAVSSSTDVYHLYADSGIRTVTVTASDSDGGTTTASTQVAVSPLTATGTANPSVTVYGQATTFNVTVLPAGASIEQYIWDFGEGDPVATGSNSIVHVFQSRGTKTVSVQVVPTAGKPLVVLIQLEVS